MKKTMVLAACLGLFLTGLAADVVPIADLGYWAGSRFVPADGEHWAWIAHDSVSGKKCAFVK